MKISKTQDGAVIAQFNPEETQRWVNADTRGKGWVTDCKLTHKLRDKATLFAERHDCDRVMFFASVLTGYRLLEIMKGTYRAEGAIGYVSWGTLGREFWGKHR